MKTRNKNLLKARWEEDKREKERKKNRGKKACRMSREKKEIGKFFIFT